MKGQTRAREARGMRFVGEKIFAIARCMISLLKLKYIMFAPRRRKINQTSNANKKNSKSESLEGGRLLIMKLPNHSAVRLVKSLKSANFQSIFDAN